MSPGSDHVGEEASVERPVVSCGHLCRRMDTILPVGNAPRTHMVDGLLTSSGCPERSTRFEFAKRAEAEGGLGPYLLLFWPWWGFSYQFLPFLVSQHITHRPSPTSQPKLAQRRRSATLRLASPSSPSSTVWGLRIRNMIQGDTQGQVLSREITQEVSTTRWHPDLLISFQHPKAYHSSLVPVT